MASASSSSAKNLFHDSKRRLADRVAGTVNNVASVGRQIVRGSRSNDVRSNQSLCILFFIFWVNLLYISLPARRFYCKRPEILLNKRRPWRILIKISRKWNCYANIWAINAIQSLKIQEKLNFSRNKLRLWNDKPIISSNLYVICTHLS